MQVAPSKAKQLAKNISFIFITVIISTLQPDLINQNRYTTCHYQHLQQRQQSQMKAMTTPVHLSLFMFLTP